MNIGVSRFSLSSYYCQNDSGQKYSCHHPECPFQSCHESVCYIRVHGIQTRFDASHTHGGDDYGSGDGDTGDVSRVSYQLGQGRDYAVLRAVNCTQDRTVVRGIE